MTTQPTGTAFSTDISRNPLVTVADFLSIWGVQRWCFTQGLRPEHRTSPATYFTALEHLGAWDLSPGGRNRCNREPMHGYAYRHWGAAAIVREFLRSIQGVARP